MMRSCVMLIMLVVPQVARGGQPRPDDITVRENLGAAVPLDLAFVDENGARVTLRDYFAGDKPVLLALAYYRCPMLCGLVLKGAATAIRELGWKPGGDFRVLTVSFDPKDTPVEAVQKRRAILGAEAETLPQKAWSFLSTSNAADITRLADALGFVAQRIDDSREFAHPAVLFVLTPDGKVSRYLYGIDYPPRDVKLALLEAGDGKIGTTIDRIMLRCFRFDPATRRYGIYVEGMVKGGALLSFGFLAVALRRLWRKDRERSQS